MSNMKAITSLLSRAKRVELCATLENMQRHEIAGHTGVWCQQSRFAVVALTVPGQPTRWHVAGPLEREEARQWLGCADALLTTPTEGARH